MSPIRAASLHHVFPRQYFEVVLGQALDLVEDGDKEALVELGDGGGEDRVLLEAVQEDEAHEALDKVGRHAAEEVRELGRRPETPQQVQHQQRIVCRQNS